MSLILYQQVRWREPYGSAGLNKKSSGIVEPGVYQGFELSAGGGMELMISPSDDFPASVAVVERDGYSITIQAPSAGKVVVPSTGNFYVCLEAYFTTNSSGYQQIVFRNSPEDHHVVLGKVSIPNGVTEITEAMISLDGRIEGNPSNWLIEVITKYTELQSQTIGLDTRLSNLENWAKSQGYDPDTIYNP